MEAVIRSRYHFSEKPAVDYKERAAILCLYMFFYCCYKLDAILPKSAFIALQHLLSLPISANYSPIAAIGSTDTFK
jgi:hypothetical protein